MLKAKINYILAVYFKSFFKNSILICFIKTTFISPLLIVKFLKNYSERGMV